ncbi:acetyl-CoA C-acetyltransferase/acetyl-CoA acyltransferase [Halovenus aranensis]|uniref:Acetyl-CoA C-acetyltransferase/acetyl-CoA acyltransferase n=1 Tax=Halovenus aranensis TaxID=890420 RepID=A0A1G8U4N5_9EURY|nr:3-ketoacyl-CoA thiolase [Halovenus aranensis]SDJ48717.1 acetyl-CoA C-acetyltransferase/acetyl-CoA acyltransferase [Halovenus aranensis]
MDVAVLSASMTQFGTREGWVRDLATEAALDCLDDTGVGASAVDHLYLSNMASGEFEGQTGVMNALAYDIGAVPAYTQRVGQTSASGGAGLYAAWQSIASGASEMTLLVGAEKMTHRTTGEASDIIASLTHPSEYAHGVTLPSFAGLAARLYLDRFDAPRESLAHVAVKNHDNARNNPDAQFQKSIDVETALESPMVADPLRLYDYCPLTDGSAALLFCPASVAREYADEFVVLSGVAGATDTHVVHERDDPTWMDAVAASGEQAFEMAGLGPDDIDVAELHDMVTLLEPLQLEAFGFAERGEGWRYAMDGTTTRDGSLPVNTSGGLKARGHPLGATGVAQAVEIYRQLLGEAGQRQVEAEAGLTCNVGGFGNCVTSAVLEVAR